MSQTGLCGLCAVSPKAVKDPRGRKDTFLSVHHFFRARSRNLSHEDFKKRATRGWKGIFHFLEASKNRVKELLAVAVEGLHLSAEEECVQGEEIIVGYSVKRALENMADVNYINAGEPPLCDRFFESQLVVS